MDVSDAGALATQLAASAVTQSLNVGLLKSVQNLAVIQGGEFARSIGLGNAIDAYA